MPAQVPARGFLGLALRRARADSGPVLASALVVVVAAAALVAAAVHPAAAANRGAIRILEAADPAAAAVVVITDVAPAKAAATNAAVREILAGALGPAAVEVVASARSESYGLATTASSGGDPLLVFGSAEGLATRAHLVAGAWPASGGATLEAVLTQPAAATLKVAVGDRLDLASRLDPDRRVAVVVVGIAAVDDRTDPAWAGDPLLLDGSTSVGPFTTAGPLLVAPDALAPLIVAAATTTWVAIPSFAGVPTSALPDLAASSASIPDRLTARLGRTPAITVRTELPALFREAAAGLDRAGSGSLAMTGPLVAVAMYALVMVSAVIVERRRGSSALLRSRGAGPAALIRLALGEVVPLALLAALAGVPLGVGIARLLGGAEGWAGSLLPSTASPWTIIAVALGTAAAGVAGLLLPTIGSVGPLAELRRLARRRRGGAAATRSGIDIAAVVVAALLAWQLRSGASSAATSGRGLGPLEVAAPAMVLLAGALLSLRITPLLARGLESLGGRGQGAASATIGRSLGRRGDAHATIAVLVVGATATAILCASLGRSWTGSQVDQAAHATAADVSGGVAGRPGASLPGARASYLAIPGVTAASPVVTATFDAGPALRRGTLVAVPGQPALAAAALRGDLADRPMADLLAGLAAARPSLELITLPGGTAVVRARVEARLAPPDSGSAGTGTADAAGLRLALVAQTPDGTLVRTAAVTPDAADPGAFTVRLPEPATSVVAVEVEVTPKSGAGVAGTIRVTRLEAGPTADALTPVMLPTDGWSFTKTGFGVTAQPIGTSSGTPDTAGIPADDPLLGPGATTVALRPAALATLAASPMVALADPTTLAAAGSAAAPGDPVAVRFNLADTRRLDVRATIASFPGVEAPGLAVVDLGAWQLAGYGASGEVPAPTAWWLAAATADAPAVARVVTAGEFPLQDVATIGGATAARLADPVADAVLGSLGAVAVGSLLIAILGLVAASSGGAGTRRGDVAVMRAQGLSARAIAAWIAAEEAFPIAAGVALGTALGALTAWLVVPPLVRALQGAVPVPPVTVAMPLDLLVGIAMAGILLAAALGAARHRAVMAPSVAAALRLGVAGSDS